MRAKAPFIGLISDTHGLLRQRCCVELAGASLIIHAGDIGDPRVLTELEIIAPVVAVRGNMDQSSWSTDLPRTAVAEHAGFSAFVLHDVFELDINPQVAGFDAVISGHTHAPASKLDNGVLFVNPGSAGPRRTHHPATLMRLHLCRNRLNPELVVLDAS